MKVKIAGQYYDSEEEPIMIILTERERLQIANMKGKKYCSYPDIPEYTDNNFEKIDNWMKD